MASVNGGVYRPVPLETSKMGSRNEALTPEIGDDLLRAGIRLRTYGFHDDFRGLRGLIGAVDAGEILDLAVARFQIKPFRIARHADVDRGIHVDFNKFSLPQHVAGHASLRAERRNKRD